MTGDQYASPPCFLHELDPDFLATEHPEKPKKVSRPPSPGEPEQDPGNKEPTGS